MRGLFNKVSDPLKVRRTLYCVAANNNHLNTYSHIHVKQNLQSSSNFMHGKNQKTNLVHLYIHLVETFASILSSKIVFKKFFWLKLSILEKETTCTWR